MADLTIKTRGEIAEQYRRDYLLRNPSAKVGEGTEPYARSLVISNVVAPIYANGQIIAAGASSVTATGDALRRLGEARNVPFQEATSSSGNVIVQTSANGGTVVTGDTLIEPDSQALFQATQTKAVTTGDLVSVVSQSTGLGANLPAGKKLQWVNPRPGIGLQATVYEQTDGTGLSGGAPAESEDSYRVKVELARASTATESEIIKAVENVPGVRVESAFVYPGTLGPATVGVAFTVPPGYAGGNRFPTSAQIRQVLGSLVSRFSGDDSILMQTLAATEVDVGVTVEWDGITNAWTDSTPWPSRLPFSPSSGAGAIVGSYSSATDPSLATFSTISGGYSGVTAPTAGKTVGVFSRSKRKFIRKRIVSVSGSGPWSVTFSTSTEDSDTDRIGTSEAVCPWSDSLNLIVEPVLQFFDEMGPGEQQAAFMDPGRRQKRFPSVGSSWPNKTTNRLGARLLGLPEVNNATVTEGGDFTVPSGSPGLVYLAHVRRLGVYAP